MVAAKRRRRCLDCTAGTAPTRDPGVLGGSLILLHSLIPPRKASHLQGPHKEASKRVNICIRRTPMRGIRTNTLAAALCLLWATCAIAAPTHRVLVLDDLQPPNRHPETS